MLFDSHAHLDLMQEEELTQALKKAKLAQVNEIISCATTFASNEKNLELSKKYAQIKAAIGLYPLDAVELSEIELDKAFYFFKAEIKNATAIGEVGLDYKYCTKPEEQEKQIKVLKRFIELSKESNKPLIIHSRFAQRQALALLTENSSEKVLLHSFVDSEKLMKEAAKKGYFVSVGLAITQNEQIAKNITNFPLENLLFETDSPIRFNSEKIYSEKIVEIAKKVAELKKIPLSEVEATQEKNFRRLFG